MGSLLIPMIQSLRRQPWPRLRLVRLYPRYAREHYVYFLEVSDDSEEPHLLLLGIIRLLIPTILAVRLGAPAETSLCLLLAPRT